MMLSWLFWRPLLRRCALLLLLLAAAGRAQAQDFWQLQPAVPHATLQAEARGYLAYLLRNPAYTDIRFVTLTPGTFSADTAALHLEGPRGEQVTLNRQAAPQILGMQVWQGAKGVDAAASVQAARRASDAAVPMPQEVTADPFNTATLVHDGEKWVGSLMLDGHRYELQTLEDGRQVLITVDEKNYAPEGEPQVDAVAREQALAHPVVPSAERSVIRIMAVTTRNSRAARPNIRMDIVNAMAKLQRVSDNSKVAVDWVLSGILDADYDETGKGFEAIRLEAENCCTAFGRQVRAAREQQQASLASVVIENNYLCGSAAGWASKEKFTSAVNCLDYAFAHEIAHNLGANHNWNGNPDAYFNFGFVHATPPTFRTQVAGIVGCPNGCDRIEYFSTPLLSYKGVALGSAHEDNVRQLNNYRGVVEGFYPPVTTTVTLYNDLDLKGDHCSFALPEGATVYIEQACGQGWVRRLWSMKMSHVQQGLEIRVGNSSAYHRFFTDTYAGDLEMLTLAGTYFPVPAGVRVIPFGNSLLKRIDSIRSLR